MHNSGTTVQRPGLHRVQSGGACTPCERSREPAEGGRRDVSVDRPPDRPETASE